MRSVRQPQPKKHKMKYIKALATCSLMLAATSYSSFGTTVSFGVETYDTVTWLSANTGTNQATGTTTSTSVDFSTGSFTGGGSVITVGNSADYAFDPAFDALSYEPGDIESLNMFAISAGPTTITLVDQANSILLFIASGGGFTPGLDAGQWEFDSVWSLSIIDSVGLEVAAGNILKEVGGSGPQGGTGVVRIARVDETPFNTVSFSNPGGGGGNGDGMSLGIAVSPIPEPSSALLCLIGLGSLVVIRKRK